MHTMAATFESELAQWHGPAAWHFVSVPEQYAPDFAGSFGRAPVIATVDAHTWATSVWRDKKSGWLLAVPKRVRGTKTDGDAVTVSIEVDHSRL